MNRQELERIGSEAQLLEYCLNDWDTVDAMLIFVDKQGSWGKAYAPSFARMAQSALAKEPAQLIAKLASDATLTYVGKVAQGLLAQNQKPSAQPAVAMPKVFGMPIDKILSAPDDCEFGKRLDKVYASPEAVETVRHKAVAPGGTASATAKQTYSAPRFSTGPLFNPNAKQEKPVEEEPAQNKLHKLLDDPGKKAPYHEKVAFAKKALFKVKIQYDPGMNYNTGEMYEKGRLEEHYSRDYPWEQEFFNYLNPLGEKSNLNWAKNLIYSGEHPDKIFGYGGVLVGREFNGWKLNYQKLMDCDKGEIKTIVWGAIYFNQIKDKNGFPIELIRWER